MNPGIPIAEKLVFGRTDFEIYVAVECLDLLDLSVTSMMFINV